MKRVLIFLVLVIVLVSLNWFRGLKAQDLSKLSDEQLPRLLQQNRTVWQVIDVNFPRNSDLGVPDQQDINSNK